MRCTQISELCSAASWKGAGSAKTRHAWYVVRGRWHPLVTPVMIKYRYHAVKAHDGLHVAEQATRFTRTSLMI